MPKPEIYITFRLTQPEKDLLREYCEQTRRNQTDVLRELIRGLKRRIKRTNEEI
ncbi:ribbon-helix-helix protein, CopG family [Anabaena sp. UHCC 0451]|uniref:ribbon-helix-helix protein, CopG family n=1 Tax=Anabaena sp. UHCC 0451 TaxID=2055235 RepID=UPI002B21D652|nr:ribbon-helix-helix protein, CopG family [Anabaena sp. UHCC 0451]MEA5577928.1 ribbon-helix-helix protein, CopG family [Anabaena sp. UHCC 0451]